MLGGGGQDSATISGFAPNGTLFNDPSVGRAVLGAPGGVTGVARPAAEPFGPTMWLDGRWGETIGAQQDFYTWRVMVPTHVDPGRSLFFSTVNGSLTEEGDGVLGFHSGYRRYFPSLDRIVSFGGGFDFDMGHEESFGRGVVSFGTLGRYFDAHVNGYWLLDDVKDASDDLLPGMFYRGNNIGQNRLKVSEYAYGGVDAEFGGLLPFLGRYGLRGFVGPYWYYNSDLGGTWGKQARLEVQVTEDVTVNIGHTSDNDFDSNTYVSVSMQLPDGRPSQWFRPKSVRRRLNEPMPRLRRIPVRTEANLSFEPLINPATSQPYTFAHVDPNANGGAGTGGNGTFENPFQSLELFRQGNNAGFDVIRVLPRFDATGTNLIATAPVQLFNNQRLLAATQQHTLPSAFGNIVMPGQVTGFNDPLISNSSTTPGSVVALANNNEVSGFIFDGRDGNGTIRHVGIAGTNINSFNINRNAFQNYASGVTLTNASGQGQFNNNTLTGTAGTSVDGFSLTNNPVGAPQVLNLGINNNTATDHTDAGFEILADSNWTINANNAAAGLDVSNNTSNNNGTGWRATAQDTGAGPGGVINVSGTNNNFDGNTAAFTGGAFLANGGTINVTSWTNISASNNANGTGLAFIASTDGGGNAGTITLANLQGLTTDGNGLNGTLIQADGVGSSITGSYGITGGTTNSSSGNGQTGLAISAINGGTVGTIAGTPFLVNNAVFGQPGTGNGDGGLGITADGPGGGTNIQIGSLVENSGVLIDSNVDFGLGIFTGGTSNNTIVMQRSVIQNTTDNAATVSPQEPGGDGIYIARRGDSLQNITIGNLAGQTGGGNVVSDNAGDSIQVYAAGGAPLPAGFTPNTLRYDGNTFNNGSNGLRAQLFGDTVFVFTGINNTHNNIGTDGVWITTNNNSAIGDPIAGTASTWLGNRFFSVGADGFHFDQFDNSFANVRIGADAAGNRTVITDVGNAGFLLNNSSTMAGGTPATNTYVIQSTDLQMGATAGTRGGGDGITFNQSGTRSGVLTVGGAGANQNVNISDAGNQGVNANVSNGNANVVTMTAVNVTNSGDNGIDFSHSGLSALNATLIDVDSTFNEDRGLNILVTATNPGGFANPPYYSNFQIGDGTGAAPRSNFSNNGLQGLFFETNSPTVLSDTQAFIDANNNAGDGLPLGLGNTVHDLNTPVFVTSRLAVTGANVQFNGTRLVADGTDGLVLTPGTNTQAIVSLDRLTVSGNNGNDIRIQPISSGNPANSTNNNPPANPPGATTTDTLVSDPIALLSLLMGAIDTNADGIPDTVAANTGNEVQVSTVGQASALGGSTSIGIFTNNDVTKGNNRTVRMQMTVFNAVSPDAPANVFIDNLGNQQTFDQGSLGSVFDNASVTLDGSTFFGGPQPSVLYTPLAFPF